LKKETRELNQKWLDVKLPQKAVPWIGAGRKAIRVDRASHRSLKQELRNAREQEPWKWPKRRIFFFADMHADADAFIASLIASGGIVKSGPEDDAFELTKRGRKGLFVIGGDCIDKGPSSPRLLRVLRTLKDRGARLKILAGNHDVRMLIGTRSIAAGKDPRNEHFFVRMGPKMVPFLREVWDEYLADGNAFAAYPVPAIAAVSFIPRKSGSSGFRFTPVG